MKFLLAILLFASSSAFADTKICKTEEYCDSDDSSSWNCVYKVFIDNQLVAKYSDEEQATKVTETIAAKTGCLNIGLVPDPDRH